MESPRLLGFVDAPVEDESILHITESKIGGLPKFPKTKFGRKPPTNCPLCGRVTSLVVSVYAPLNGSEFHRWLYIFACTNKPCWNNANSWFCYRVQSRDESEKGDSKTKKDDGGRVTANKWVDDEDDWGDEDEDEDNNDNNTSGIDNGMSNNEEEALAQAMAVSMDLVDESEMSYTINKENNNDNIDFDNDNSNDQIEVITDDDPNFDEASVQHLKSLLLPSTNDENDSNKGALVTFKSFYISVDTEDTVDKSSSKSNTIDFGLIKDVENEQYERSQAKHGDQFMLKFTKAINKQPGQVLRYWWSEKHEPLLLQPLKKFDRYCPYCKSRTLCELQLLPTLITYLKCENFAEESLEFGTAMIFSCEQSCWDENKDDFRMERVVVQAELLNPK